MIEAVYRIGRILPKEDFLEEFIDDIGENYKNVFKVVVDIEDPEKPKYEGIEFEEYDSTKKLKYFYKRGSANGPDKTPTSKITTIDKTFKNKIKNLFGKFIQENKKFLKDNEKVLIENLQELINDKLETIKNDLIALAKKDGLLRNNDSFKEPSIITFTFNRDGKHYYVGELDLFVNVFKNNENEAYKSFYKKSGVESRAKDKYCFICNKKADEVWGFVNTYNFYTADKKSYIAGGFIPIC